MRWRGNRAYALQHHRALSLRGQPSALAETVSCLESSDRTDDILVNGENFLLQHLRIFDLIDETFVDCWNERCQLIGCRDLTLEKVIRLNTVFVARIGPEGFDPNSIAAPSEFASTPRDIQRADILVTQHWLRNRLWHMSMLHGLVSIHPPTPEVGGDYAVDIASVMLGICDKLSMSSIEANGIGFVRFLADCTQSFPGLVSLPCGRPKNFTMWL